jgi:tetratricopeptide (TPR) repeat protein
VTATTSSEEREFLLRSIRDLDAEFAAGDIEEDDYRALRDDYVARAAALLKDDDPLPEPDPGGQKQRNPWRLVATLVALAFLASGAGLAVARSSGERLPGQEATGNVPEGSGGRIDRAQRLVSEGKVLDAIKLYDQVLAEDPQHPVALAQRGWLVSRAGLIDEGLVSIDKAIASDPTYAEAHFFRGMVLLQAKDDPAGAAQSFQAVLDNRPPPELVKYVQDARRRALAEAQARTLHQQSTAQP